LFIAPAGSVIVGADIDRVELVVLGWYLSTVMGDNGLLEECNKDDGDPHQSNADRWGVSRMTAKTLIFLLVYGGGASLIFKRGMAPTLEAAEDMVKQVEESQPSIQKLKDKVWSKCVQRGFIKNTFNCRGVYPELESKQKWRRAAGERASFNYLIQRTARDIMHYLTIQSLPIIEELGAKALLLVHDEIIVECPQEKAEELKQRMTELWGKRYDILPGSKINAEWNIGNNWNDVK
jgi:DNA polymerase-1